MQRIRILAGDCCASLAKEFGFADGNAIYQAPENQDFKKSHRNMHVLTTNQVLCIPDKKVKREPLKLEQYNRFVVKGVITEFIVSIGDFAGSALANHDYELQVNGIKHSGKLDSAGKLKVKIDATARTGELIVYLDKDRKNNLFWTLEFGALQDVVDIAGIQARLNNLGYVCRNEDGDLDDSTKAAISQFKLVNGLAVNDRVDGALVSKLNDVYGF